jgi:Rrf2 family protein
MFEARFFMLITKQSDYALLLMVELAKKSGQTVSLGTFSVESEVSFYFLQRIARKLRKAGLIEGKEGRTGGYVLRKPPRSISMGDIVRAVEGPINLLDCASEGSSIVICERCDNCEPKRAWRSLHAMITTYLDSVTLQHILDGTIPT